MLSRYRKIYGDSRFSAVEDRGLYFVCGTAAAKLTSFISFYLLLSPKQAELAKVTMFAVGNANEPIGVSPYAEKYSAP